ncbi:MAG TPA: hypothetical protein VIK80_06200 [Flavihumibacter sp.]|jgi:hypothetical protein
MKYTNQLGALASLLIIGTCFVTWVTIPGTTITISGMATEGTNYGRPGLMNIIMCSAAFILFLVPKVWAKRTNLFVSGFNAAWAFRNFILVSTCHAGDCPDRHWGLFVYLILALFQLVMACLPRLELKEAK